MVHSDPLPLYVLNKSSRSAPVGQDKCGCWDAVGSNEVHKEGNSQVAKPPQIWLARCMGVCVSLTLHNTVATVSPVLLARC
jgi:hypothetical protein